MLCNIIKENLCTHLLLNTAWNSGKITFISGPNNIQEMQYVCYIFSFSGKKNKQKSIIDTNVYEIGNNFANLWRIAYAKWTDLKYVLDFLSSSQLII